MRRLILRRPIARAAFTLVELLVVIMIIAILAGMLVAGASRAILAGRRAQMITEIGQLDTALQSYKGTAGAFPPDCGIFNPASPADATPRQNRIMAHLRKAFPKYQVLPGLFAPNSVADYLDVRQEIINVTGPGGYTDRTGATPIDLDLNNLDQAEALVFWLSGLPAPHVQAASTPTAFTSSNRFLGFSAEARAPFAVGGSRLSGPFEFDPARLSDVDDDGWLEYFPAGTPVATNMPPYVYFDAVTYNAGQSFPYPAVSPSGYTVTLPTFGLVTPTTAAADWLCAVPYTSRIAPTTQWVNSQKFQIICAGADNIYGAPVLKEFPLGTNYLLQGDFDNVTNFTSGTLEDAQE